LRPISTPDLEGVEATAGKTAGLWAFSTRQYCMW